MVEVLFRRPESGVLRAFLARREAQAGEFHSDGCRLYRGADLIARWEDGRMRILSQPCSPDAEELKDLLVYHLFRSLQRRQTLHRKLRGQPAERSACIP
jgi:hypothetical protein